MGKIEFTNKEKQILKEIGRGIKEALVKMPKPQPVIYPPDTAKMIGIWDEEEGILRNLEGMVVVYRKSEQI